MQHSLENQHSVKHPVIASECGSDLCGIDLRIAENRNEFIWTNEATRSHCGMLGDAQQSPLQWATGGSMHCSASNQPFIGRAGITASETVDGYRM